MLKAKILVFILVIILSLNFIIYRLDNAITPTVMAVADAEIRARSIEIINKEIIDEYSTQFNYHEIIHVDKDDQGNIVLLQADTLKMNKIACDVSINSQNKLRKFGEYGVSIPFGYIFKNNLLANLGPTFKVKMEPVGNIETKYISAFESAGINQTRHKIYVSFKTNMRIILPMKSNEVSVVNEVPISETIIVGKIPNTSVQLDLDSAGFKLNNDKNKKNPQ